MKKIPKLITNRPKEALSPEETQVHRDSEINRYFIRNSFIGNDNKIFLFVGPLLVQVANSLKEAGDYKKELDGQYPNQQIVIIKPAYRKVQERIKGE